MIRRGDLAGARETAARVESDGQRSVAWMKQQKLDDSMLGDAALIYNGELHALLAAAEGKPQDAITELQSMTTKEHAMPLEFGPPNIEKPTDELLGELLLKLNRLTEVREAFQTALARAWSKADCGSPCANRQRNYGRSYEAGRQAAVGQ